MLRKFSVLSLMSAALIGSGHFAQISQAAVVEYSAGHGDIGVAFHEGEFELHYHFGANAVIDGTPIVGDLELEPNEAYVRVKDIARDANFEIGDTAYDFTGRTASDPDLWILPPVNVPNQPFIGIATEELVIADWSTPITFTLDGVNFTPFGTGDASRAHFSLFIESVGPPTRVFDTFDGDFSNDSFTMGAGNHNHYVYGFTEEGLYEVTLTASGTHNTLGFLTSTGTFSFAVGDNTPGPVAIPEPASMLALLGGASALAFVRHRRSRKQIRAE